MNYKETLIDLGYDDAGVDIGSNFLNSMSNLLYNKEVTRKTISAAFKYVVLNQLKPEVVATPFDESANSYYSEHFWKVYPEKEVEEEFSW